MKQPINSTHYLRHVCSISLAWFGVSITSFAQNSWPLWFPAPIVPLSTSLNLVSDGSNNRIHFTLNASGYSSSDTTTVTGNMVGVFEVDTSTNTSTVFYMTGGGRVFATNMRFLATQTIPFFGTATIYDLSTQNVSGYAITPGLMAAMNPINGNFDASNHQVIFDQGTLSGMTIDGPVDEDFSTNHLIVNGSGTGDANISLSSTSGGFKNYHIELIIPIHVNQQQPSGTLTGTGTIKATGTLSVPLPSDYYTWLNSHPTLADTNPDNDPDMDGFPNVVEYVLNSDPTLAASNANAPTLTPTETGGLKFVYLRRAESKATTSQSLEISSTLSAWTAAQAIPNLTEGNVVIESTAQSGVEKVTVTLDSSQVSHGRVFGRLRVSSKM